MVIMLLLFLRVFITIIIFVILNKLAQICDNSYNYVRKIVINILYLFLFFNSFLDPISFVSTIA